MSRTKKDSADEAATNAMVDVAIVGGGFAGLSAALEICDLNASLPDGQKVKFVLLEAGDGYGGRTSTDGTDYFDTGAGYVGGSQNYIQLMLRRFPIPTTAEYLPGEKAWLYQSAAGETAAYPGNNPFAFPGGMDTVKYLGFLDALTLEVRSHLADVSFWPLAVVMDGTSVQEWMDAEVGKTSEPMPIETCDLIRVAIRSAFSVEPREISMLYALRYAATAGSFAALVDVTGGTGAAEATRFLYGTQNLRDQMVKEIKKAGAAIADLRKNVGVTTIKQFADANGRLDHVDIGLLVGNVASTLSAKTVIVAISPASLCPATTTAPAHTGITYLDNGPVLPAIALRRQLEQSMVMGQTIKGFLSFKRPFWREMGLMGYVLFATEKTNQVQPPSPFIARPLDWVMDNCWTMEQPLDGQSFQKPPAHPYQLMTFIAGDSARYWTKRCTDEHNRNSLRNAIVAQLESVFGAIVQTELVKDNNGVPIYSDHDWYNSPSRGGPAGILGKNTANLLPALKARCGRIFWAGSETADEWAGYMNGALQSGIRAADEAVHALFDDPRSTAAPPMKIPDPIRFAGAHRIL